MANRDVLAIGTSAGGVQALRFLVGGFRDDLPASVLIVIHLSAQFQSSLDAILTKAGPLPARFANEGETVEHGRIYIAPPGRHMLLERNKLRLGIGPRENNSRPAIDPLFRSVGLCCGPRAVGVVLTGTLGDGSSGLHMLKQCGGITAVQDPEDAAFSDMPRAALSRSRVDHVVALVDMPALLDSLVSLEAGSPVDIPENVKYEVEIAKSGQSNMSTMDHIGQRSAITCPDCHGVMWKIDDGDAVRYRCHVGHAYTAELMNIAINENLHRALGSALRALEERIAVTRKLEEQSQERGSTATAASWARKARELDREAEIIRKSIRRIDELAFQFAQQPQTLAGG